MSDTPAKKMSKSEAKEIRSLVKSEYAFLDGEIGGQVQRLKADIRKQFDAEAEAALVTARKRIDKLRKKATALEELAHEELRALQAEGFELGGYHKGDLITVNINDGALKVATVEKRMKAAFDAVDAQVHEARRGFKLGENEAVRALTLNMCTTDEARAFIEAIPSLADLVQAPDLKQLTS